MVKTSRSCLGEYFFSPLGWAGVAFPIFSKVVIISWKETKKNYKDLLSVAEYFVDLFLFIPPFQLICWPLAAVLKTGPSGYVFLLKSLEDAVLLVTSS